MTSTQSKKFEKPGTYKFDNVEGLKGSQTVAFVSGEVSGVSGLEDIYFKTIINIDDKTITIQDVTKYNDILEGYDVNDILTKILNNINENTLFASNSSGHGSVLLSHTPLKSQIHIASDSALGRAALILAEIPADLGNDIPELEVDTEELPDDQILSLEA